MRWRLEPPAYLVILTAFCLLPSAYLSIVRDPAPVAVSKSPETAEFKPYTETIPGTHVKFDMVPIPGGTFLMGSPASESHRSPDEGPQHPVTIRPFWMGKAEVTWEE